MSSYLEKPPLSREAEGSRESRVEESILGSAANQFLLPIKKRSILVSYKFEILSESIEDEIHICDGARSDVEPILGLFQWIKT